MEVLFLTKATGILRPFAIVLGWIMNYIYIFLEFLGIENIGLTIILFTLIVNIIMLPLTIKQQKFTKLSSVMNPEIQKIQKKYQGKSDDVSMRRMQAETQAVYKKYGTNTMTSCLYLLIQLPILFALYRVIYNIPAYIDSVYAIYEPIATGILNTTDGMTLANELIDSLSLSVSDFTEDTFTVNKIIDMLYKLTSNGWESFTETFGSNVIISENVEELTRINSFIGGLSVADKPTENGWWPGITVPILAGVAQYASVKISTASTDTNKKTGNEQQDNMNQQMQTMNTIMPLFSVIICFSLQLGIGIYWIASAVIRTIISVCVNKYLDIVGVDKIVEKNMEKAKKKAEKQKEKNGGVSSDKFEEYAKTKTKNIDVQQPVKRKSISELASTSVAGDAGKAKNSSGKSSGSKNTKNSKNSQSSASAASATEDEVKLTTVEAASESVGEVKESVKADEAAKKTEADQKKKKKRKRSWDAKREEAEAEAERQQKNIAIYANMLKKK